MVSMGHIIHLFNYLILEWLYVRDIPYPGEGIWFCHDLKIWRLDRCLGILTLFKDKKAPHRTTQKDYFAAINQ